VGRRVTRASPITLQPPPTTIEPTTDQAHEIRSDRAHYDVHSQDDGGTWRGPTDAAWMTRILRGARPPRTSTGVSSSAVVPHG
jgi:hypothetical protein